MWQWKSHTRISGVSFSRLALAGQGGEEERLIWVVGAESNHIIPARIHHERVSAHGRRTEVGGIAGLVVACIFGAAQDSLEGVAV